MGSTLASPSPVMSAGGESKKEKPTATGRRAFPPKEKVAEIQKRGATTAQSSVTMKWDSGDLSFCNHAKAKEANQRSS